MSNRIRRGGFHVVSTCIVIALAVVLFRGMTSSQQKFTPATMRRVHDPVQVPGEALGPLLGKPLDSMRLFAAKKGAMAQIVYQIDERTPDGTFIFELGVAANKEKANHVLDPQDFLVFRIWDTGDRVPKEAWPSQEGVEIELEDPLDGGRSYCYLIRFPNNPPPRLQLNTISLGNWDPWKKSELPFIVKGYSYNIEGLVNKIGNRYYKTALNKSFSVPKAAGGTDQNLIDGLRLRATAEFFFGKSKVEFNETNIIGGIDAITQGYIRGYGLQWFTVSLPMHLEGPRLYSDVFTYDRAIVAPMQIHIPMNPKSVITRAVVEYGYGLNENAIGMRFYSPNCPEGVVIDGKNTDRKKNMSQKWAPWFLLTGPQGSMVFRVHITKSMLDQVDAKTILVDDRSQSFPPENTKGSIGFARNIIEFTSVKAGMYEARLEWYFPPNFWRGGTYDKQELNQFFNIIDNPIKIKASGKTVVNQCLTPPKLRLIAKK